MKNKVKFSKGTTEDIKEDIKETIKESYEKRFYKTIPNNSISFSYLCNLNNLKELIRLNADFEKVAKQGDMKV